MENTAVIILAGGKGTRMESDLPKALVLFKGEPFIARILKTIEIIGFQNKPIVVVGHHKEDVMAFADGRCVYAVQEEQLGTGHAVLVASSEIPSSADTVVVLYADQPLISEKTIRDLITKRKVSGAQIVMGTAKLPNFDGWHAGFYKSFSRIMRNAAGEPIRSIEFRDTTDEEKNITEVNPCYFAFEKKWMEENLQKIGNNNTQGEYYLTDLLKLAFDQHMKIETIDIEPREALGANSKAELAILETL